MYYVNYNTFKINYQGERTRYHAVITCYFNQFSQQHFKFITMVLVRDSSAVRRLFVRLAGAVGRQSALHKENSGFATPTLGWHMIGSM